MTTIIPWPAGVPSCVMPMSPQGGLRDNRLSFETDDAVTPVERPRTSWAPELYQVTMVPMDLEMFQAFQAWFRGPLAYGSLPFVMDHPITREPTVWRIVKGDPPYQVSKVLAMRSADVRGISVSFGIQSMPLAVPQFSPATLFANGEHGAWFDPSDLSSMFQDAAGTIPAAYGQPVGLILDKSGNGNHAAQATATARPTLMQDGDGRAYLQSDGVDDVLTGSWTSGWAAPAEVHWLGQNNGTSRAGIGGLGIQYQQTATRFGTLVSSNWIFGAPAGSNRESLTTSDGNMSAVAVRGGSATDDLMVAYRDGVVLGSKVPGVALGTAQSGTLQIGDTGYQSRFYGGVMIFRELTSAERAQLVDYFHGASA